MEIDYNDEFKRVLNSLSEKENQRKFVENKALFLDNVESLTLGNRLLLYSNLAQYSSIFGNEEDAIIYSSEVTEIIPQIGGDISESFLKQFYLNKGISLSRLASKTENEKLFNKAEKAFDKYVSLSISDATRGIGVRGYFYSFRKINDFTFQDLKQNKITVSNPAKFNDPFDCLFYHFIKEKKDSSFDNRALRKSFEKIRIRSFVSERFLNRSTLETEERKIKPVIDILMWSHYADSHKGICVLYNFEFGVSQSSREVNSSFFKVDYFKDEIVDIGKDTKIGFEDGFLKKNKCWKYEDEVRLLYFDPKCNTDFIHLPLGEAKVSAIYFGLYCSPEHVDMVKKIFENTDAKFYKMKTDPTNIYNLIAEECSE